MKRLLCSLLFLIVTGALKSQVTLEQNRYIEASFAVVNMFDVDLTNLDGTTYNGYFTGKITHIATGEIIAEATTPAFAINPGRNMYTSAGLNPAFTYYDTYTASTGKIAYGNYEICVTLKGASNNEPIAVGCINLSITSISPPYLLSPPDHSLVNTKYPFLVWTLPGASPNANYHLVLTEIFQNQTPYDALVNNFRMVDAHNISTNTLAYPGTAVALEKNKSYAWQVTAYNQTDLIGTTEVWSFTVAADSVPVDTTVISTNYIILNDINLEGVYTTKDKKLYLQLDEKYIAGKVGVQVFKNEDKKTSTCHFELNKKVGMNLYTLNLDECSPGLEKNKVYMLYVTTNNQSYTLKFLLK